MTMIEFLGYLGSFIGGPFSIAVVAAASATLLKVSLVPRIHVGFDMLLPASLVWLVETILLFAAARQAAVSQQLVWFFEPKLPVAGALTGLALAILGITAIVIKRRSRPSTSTH
jgi:hypothetical protein